MHGLVPSVDIACQANHRGFMTLANFPQLKRLPVRSRLKIAEELWDSSVGDNLPVPASHKGLIRDRRVAYERGKMPTLTMTELKRSIRRR